MNTLTKLPFYVKASLLFTGIYVLISMLSIGQSIILPVLYATIFAVLISPAVNFLVKKKINRSIAITGILLFSLLIVALFILLIASQASRLNESLPQLADKFQEMISQVVSWISGYFNIREHKINTWISNTKTGFFNTSAANIGITITSISDVLVATFLVPVYIFMILYYQPHLIKFTHQVFGSSNDSKVSEILVETKSIIQAYLVGLFAEFVIVAILNTVGLLILGIEYAILLGIIGALLNIIPYIGGIIAMALFMIIALVTKAPIYVLYVSILYTFIQLIDNNYIVPKIIGSKVKLNALISIIAVIAGAALWGISGMFLSIPLIAIFKLIFDRIESLKPWGFLLGDSISPVLKINIKQGKISGK